MNTWHLLKVQKHLFRIVPIIAQSEIHVAITQTQTTVEHTVHIISKKHEHGLTSQQVKSYENPHISAC